MKGLEAGSGTESSEHCIETLLGFLQGCVMPCSSGQAGQVARKACHQTAAAHGETLKEGEGSCGLCVS